MIQFFKVGVSGHEDARRAITDIVLPEDLEIPFRILQVNIMEPSKEAISKRLPVGNHYHTRESGRIEFFVALGPAGMPLFYMCYRNFVGEEILARQLFSGDACLVPPEHSHVFVGLADGARLLVLANMAYNDAHNISDKLF